MPLNGSRGSGGLGGAASVSGSVRGGLGIMRTSDRPQHSLLQVQRQKEADESRTKKGGAIPVLSALPTGSSLRGSCLSSIESLFGECDNLKFALDLPSARAAAAGDVEFQLKLLPQSAERAAAVHLPTQLTSRLVCRKAPGNASTNSACRTTAMRRGCPFRNCAKASKW